MKRPDVREFVEKMEKLSDAYDKIPTLVATTAVNFSKERFVRQNWFDKKEVPWKQRRVRRAGGRRRSQTLLVDSGRLKRSIRKISVTKNKIIIGTDVPYAAIHNEGGTVSENVTVRTHTRRTHTRKRSGRKEIVKSHIVNAHSRRMNLRIPKRQFIGNSAELTRRIEVLVTDIFHNALK